MINTEYNFGEPHKLAEQIGASEEKVEFKNIFSSGNGGVVLVGFKAGQELATHSAPADVMVTVLEGSVEFTVLGSTKFMNTNDFLLMEANTPHSVKALADSKIMLTKIKS